MLEKIRYNRIKDRYEHPLKEPKQDPTLLNELADLDYPHSFQHERADLVDLGYNVSSLIDKARLIRDLGER